MDLTRIGDPDQAAPRGELPKDAGDQNQRETSPEAKNDSIMHPSQITAITDGRRIRCIFELVDPRGIAGDEKLDFPTGLNEAQQSQQREQKSAGKEQNGIARKPRPEPEREKQTDAAVRPGDHNQQRLPDSGDRSVVPQGQNRFRIQIFHAVPLVREPGTDEVNGEKRRNTEPKQKLERLPKRHAQVMALINRPER